MPLQILPATEDDMLRSVIIENAAYPPSAIGRALFPSSAVEDPAIRAASLASMVKSKPACRCFKVVDSSLTPQDAKRQNQDMIAFAMWYVWDTPPTNNEATAASADFGPDANTEACRLYLGGMARRRDELMHQKPYLFLKLLHTDPNHQMRGAASLLVQWGCQEADRLGLPAFLYASDTGRRLYEKFGFQVEELFAVDLSPWGGPTKTQTPLMLRLPKQA